MKDKIRTLRIIHIALCAGVALAYFFIGDFSLPDSMQLSDIDTSLLIYLFIPIAAFYGSNFIYKQQLTSIDANLKLEDQFPAYQAANMVRWAILEGAAFMFLFAVPELNLVGILLIGYMLFLRPSEQGMKRDLQAAGR